MKRINNEYYASFEIAKLLKEMGFNWKCRCYYEMSGKLRGKNSGNFIDYNSPLIWQNNGNDDTQLYSAPALDVVQRWLREVKGIHICVKADAASTNCKYFVTVIISDTKWGNVQDENKKTILFITYEKAQEAGIKKALEIILEKGE